MMRRNKKIVVGMSGGVDSSMALLLLKEQGWWTVGVSLKYAVWQDSVNETRENVCCSDESFKIAQSVCRKLNTPHCVVDAGKDFEKEVIAYFVEELRRGRTPNPCVICNRYLKFKKLFEFAEKLGINYVATGHYAGIKKDLTGGKYQLLKPKDKEKDQTYSLCFLPQKWLSRIIFPLADYSKKEVYLMAEKQGLDFFLKRKQSQDFCFVSGRCLNCFLEKELGMNPGPIKDDKGSVIGEHQGLHFYTIGQRKGIKLAGGPYFVLDKALEDNVLVVARNEKKLYGKEALLSPYNLIFAAKREKSKLNVLAKVRYRQPLAPAALFLSGLAKRSCLKLVFAEPQKAITPGQFAVFYLPAGAQAAKAGNGSVCLGGGRII